jgi:predicted molibdopterin-dependent oxidoreductase YjgC
MLQGDHGRSLEWNASFGKKAPAKQGKRSIKGWNAHEFVHSPERLTAPLLGKEGTLDRTSRQEALSSMVSRLKGSNRSMEETAEVFSLQLAARRRTLTMNISLIAEGWRSISHVDCER